MRLIEAAERLFIRKGYDDASVEEISETAGYSRGAFYSNFDDKEQVFLAVIDRRRPKAIDDIFQHSFDGAERIAAEIAPSLLEAGRELSRRLGYNE